jgi:hypothetical protein
MLQKNPVLMYGIALIVIGIFALLISIISLVVIGFVVYYFTIYKSSKEGDLIL